MYISCCTWGQKMKVSEIPIFHMDFAGIYVVFMILKRFFLFSTSCFYISNALFGVLWDPLTRANVIPIFMKMGLSKSRQQFKAIYVSCVNTRYLLLIFIILQGGPTDGTFLPNTLSMISQLILRSDLH